jgi:hypothetical protein
MLAAGSPMLRRALRTVEAGLLLSPALTPATSSSPRAAAHKRRSSRCRATPS